MACNCAATEQIEELYRKYGEKGDAGRNQTISFKIKKLLTSVGVSLLMIPISIYLFFYVLSKGIKGEDISVSEFFNLRKKNV